MLITAIILGFCLNLVLLLVLLRRIRQEKAAFMAGLSLYFEKQGEKPSEFSNIVSMMADEFGVKVAASLKSTFMGVQSGDAKATQQVEAAMVEDGIAGQNPILGMILQSYPALAKKIMKNPALASKAMELLGSPSLSKIGNHTGEPGGSQQIVSLTSY
jgi:hypothetical protein